VVHDLGRVESDQQEDGRRGERGKEPIAKRFAHVAALEQPVALVEPRLRINQSK